MASLRSISLRNQIDFMKAEKNYKFDLKTRLNNDLVDVAMLKRFLLYWRDKVTKGQWTDEDLPFFEEAIESVKFAKDDPYTPYDETTFGGIRQRLFKAAEKNFGSEFANEVVLKDPYWEPGDTDFIDKFLNPSGDTIDKLVRRFLAGQASLDSSIANLEGEIHALTLQQMAAADDTSDVEDD